MDRITDNDMPTVAVVMPARNAADTVGSALDSILRQDYRHVVDIVVAVPPSDEATTSAVMAMSSRDERIRVVANESGKTPSGLNAAIDATASDIVVRCDAHAILPDGYVSRAVATMRQTGAVNVGGVQDAYGNRPIQRAIAAAMTSRFGVGDSRFHTGGRAGFVDTVYLGVFRRDALIAAGAFDTSLERNQDYELNYRLRVAGGGVYFDPALRVAYLPRPSLRLLARQYWEYGRWKREVIRRAPGSARWRQFAPPLLVLGLAGSVLLAILGMGAVALAIPALYATALVAAVCVNTYRHADIAMLALFAVYPTMHVSWGAAFLMPRSPRGGPGT